MGKRRRPNHTRRRQGPLHRINHRIRASKVRLVGLEDESQNVVHALSAALRMAEEAELDLVEIAPNADPPVCKIVDYSKFRYEQKKRQKEQKAKQHTVTMKEIRFGPNTDDHDFNFKMRHARKFLEEGNKLRAYVHFRGRSILYTNRGRELLERFSQDLSDISKIEMRPRMEGKRMVIILSPTKPPKK